MLVTVSAADTRRFRRRSEILQVARRAFLRNGYDQTSMSDIANDLGGSKGTLWNYFDSKEALFAEVIDYATEDFRSQLAGILSPKGDLKSALIEFCKGLLRILLTPERLSLHRLVESEAGRFPTVAARFYRKGPEILHDGLANYLRHQMQACQLRYVDPLVAAKTLTALALGDYHRHYLLHPNKPVSTDQIADHAAFAVDGFLRIFAT